MRRTKQHDAYNVRRRSPQRPLRGPPGTLGPRLGFPLSSGACLCPLMETQREVALTSIAPEIVNLSCAAPDRTEACGRLVFNPATGALEIGPAYRDKPAKAVMRDLRRTKLRLYFMFARLYCLKFALQSRSAVLRLLHKAARDFPYLVVKDVEQSQLDFQNRPLWSETGQYRPWTSYPSKW